MQFCITRLSWSNRYSPFSMYWDYCGSGFFIGPRTGISAFHVLNPERFRPKTGFDYCRYWAVSSHGDVLNLEAEDMECLSHVDTTVLHFDESVSKWFECFCYGLEQGQSVRCTGIDKTLEPPARNFLWSYSFDLAGMVEAMWHSQTGIILGTSKESFSSRGITLTNVTTLHTDLKGVDGFSGAPLLTGNNEVAGLISFGISSIFSPGGVLCAISMEEIMSAMKH